MKHPSRLLLATVLGAALSSPSVAAPQSSLHPQKGPATVTLGNQVATLKVPVDCVFFNKEDTAALIASSGKKPDGTEVGALLPAGSDKKKFAFLLRYQAIGYVKDDDASKLDAEKMLEDFKEGTEEANKERAAAGHPPIHVTRWAQAPSYDKSQHFVTYGLEGTSNTGPFLNYDTQMLGRRGILTVKLITDPNLLTENAQRSAALIHDTAFVAGERYSDYQPGSDKSSGMGLRELVLGGAGIAVASKLGLLAKFGKLIVWALVAFKKLGILLVAAVVSLFKKLTGRGDATSKSDTP